MSNEIENEIVAKGLIAPRITPADVEANIACEYCFTAGQALDAIEAPTTPELHLLTICVLVLKNGFTVVGTSACASPENFDAELGCKIAKKAAVDQVWPLMGYELRSKLSTGKTAEETHL